MSLLKKDKFSIRKIKGIVGSVFLGSLLFAPSVVGASTYHYLDYSSLTQTERDQLKQGRPDESKESYALDYEKDALPNTGSSQSIMTALGLLAIGSLIVIITKDNRNKKIATFLIVGATGLVTLSTASALNLNANIHESGRDGVLQISGYRYVGYLELDDKTVSSVSPASTVSPVEQPKVVTEKGEPEVQPALPEAVVTDKGEPEVQPTLPEAVVTDKGEPEVHEKPDYTQPIGANLVEPEVHEKLAYTESVGTTGMDENGNLIEPPVSDIPEYTESVGTTGVDENGNLIEPPVNDIPEYTEPISTVSEVASEREELPSLHTDIRTETIPKTTIEESDPSKFIGDDSVKEVGEDGERQIVTSYEELHGKKISEPVETVTILKEMKPKILVKGTKENPKEKTVPVLTLTKVTEDAMNRSANLNYELDNKDNAEISSIIAEIKDGDTVVKKVDLSKEKLTDAVQNLDLFKDYKIATTMIYDRGQGSETSKLDEKTLRLELKKVEIKNISSTNLVKVNDDGTEIPSDFMSEKPSDEDVKKMYLKITSRDNKVTRLAVDKIELVTEKEKELYKITASAQDLIQHVDPSKTRNEYIHYIEKPVPKVNNVYYNFNELVRDMQEHPNDEFKLGADLNATNVSAFGKSYVTKDFKGKLLSDGDNHYTIHNLSRPLFGNVIGGTIKNINLGNVDINMPWANQVAAVANIIKGGTTIENVKVKGNIVGKDWVSGFIDKIDNQGTLRNVAFIGNVTSVGDGGQFLTGIVGENWKGLVERAYVNANLIGKKAKAAGIAYWTQNEGNNNTVRQEGAIKKSIAKGTIQVTEAIESGGVVGSMKHHGSVEDSVSMMKVPNGEIFYGSSDIDYDDGYWTGDNVRRNYVVIGVSYGHSSYQRSKDKNRIRPISEEEAKSKIEATGITADKYEINEPVVNRLNRLTRREDEYKSTQDYKVDRDLAYRNIEKLQPFYNKEWIVNQGNKLAEDSNLAKKEVLSVTGMKDGQFVTDLSDIDHVMIHYADKTKEIKAVHQKESKVAQVREYSIDGLDDIVYTPNMVDKNRDQLIKDIKDRLATVELISPEVRALMDKRDTSRDPNANSDERKNGYIRDLYFEESFSETKANLDKLVKSLIENADHQLNSDEAAMKALVKKVDENKAKIVMALTYLNRYYDIKYGDMTIKNLMMFKPDFYGKSVDLLDFLIRIGSSERNIKGDRTLDAYRDMIGGTIGKSELHGFLDYNMRLFTNDTDLNDWFIHAAKNVYIVEPKTTNPDFVNKRHRAFDGLNNGVHNRMILPLLTLKNAHMFLISTYNTMAYSSFEKYGKYTEAEREAFKDKIKEVAHAQQTYLDFWSRLALPSVRDQLLKSQNRVPTPVWDNQNYHNVEGVNRMGYDKNNKPIAPIRELYGPTWRYHTTNWYMGAMASIFQDPNNNDQVYFMGTNMISPFGISAFTHETTHVNDRMLYFGGHRHRQGTDVEAYAQGMLQTPDKSGNGEYGALGLNMAYHRENDGDQWYNYDPDKLKTREDIDRYMRNYNDALMMLDHLEADAVIPKLHGNISRWFKKMDRQYRKNGELHQFDKVRELTEDEKKKIVINNIDDLVNNNLMTKHGAPSDRIYNPEDFDSAYVNINMMTGIYGGNTSQGAPGAASFKHNTFRMWGYFGYENGFISYASSKYQGEADKTNKKLLGDDFIIKKVSKDKFNNLEEWKKQYFKDVKSKAEKGFTAIEIDGRQITNYAQLKTLFAEAVQKDIDGMSDPKIKDHFKNTVDLKSKVFKALLKNTDGFFNKLFKEDI
ncbi:zinc metalloprotease ZmpD [Streptococcus pneumoniae]|uniref:zinc metalloprotease D n=1 Tax=Streptococcus pneumoniae TaxID=1313 RepID=UPI0007690365|nr:SIALI-17 repeat-containing surface protein [Streptococcus pneumoniae]MDS2771803.1 ZmpA/ZmpB/ZmpC family metallo-endopeptidase [Streptococcus pneumoniae]MDS4621341.1 ZmpA/ZmpB/ZmpC family metallo-endopeptidase [Streptococcus pneumoniae]MDS9013519.1 ZmpA/ZmpB/ZmpC family metallo-endopeptidase [Streptococcus pneumoniae]MDS9115232.1 ZmpA/ZmpB/ZmpC family metallo-endopeptidase [Streptococcus pneumoniae]MDT6251305.1 ZmpA/ZmpB/ZmpC family metallo-endopeptidase [Streptococcus pneumoniae]